MPESRQLSGLQGEAAPSADKAVSLAAAAAGAGAVFAWAACCVLPMSLAVAGLSFTWLSWIAGLRTWMTLSALAVIAVGWFLMWRRRKRCELDSRCAPPSRMSVALLSVATVLTLLALAWQPLLEPWALAQIRRFN
jgi:mercuric ion transport protein